MASISARSASDTSESLSFAIIFSAPTLAVVESHSLARCSVVSSGCRNLPAPRVSSLEIGLCLRKGWRCNTPKEGPPWRYGHLCPYLCYASNMSLHFFTFDPGGAQLNPAPGTVEQYPGGDVAVRHLEPAPENHIPVAWNTGGQLNFAATAQWVAFHQGQCRRPILVMPYLPSARGDHDATYDAQGVARLTAATGITDVIAADPHSSAWGDTAAGWGTDVYALRAADLISTSRLGGIVWDGVIAPDKGAIGRAGAVARQFGLPLLTAGKVRDSATGKLSGFTAPAGLEAGRYLLVDDICDGGGTFAGLAQAVHETQPDAELHLWVTHGLFTGRWRENLLPNFASITAANTTPDSDHDALPDEVKQHPLRPHIVDALARVTDVTPTR